MAESRDYKVLIAEAELLASPPERVFQWLAERAMKLRGKYDTAPIDEDQLELSLLARNDHFIDIGLAQYSLRQRVGRELFLRFDVEATDRNKALRLAVLANRYLSRGGIWGLPKNLFVQDDAGLTGWLSRADEAEISALFENPTVGDDFLQGFLSGKSTWGALDEGLRLVAIARLTLNPRIVATYDGIMDGYAVYSHGLVFEAGWRLAETAPTSTVWAFVLGWFYEKLRRHAYSMENPLAVARRWIPDPSDTEEAEREANDNKNGYVGNHQRVRKCLGELALKKNSKLLPDLLSNNDLALRAAAYSAAPLNPKQIFAAYDKDGPIAVQSAVSNKELWKRLNTREALKETCWKAVHDDKHSDLMPANLYNSVREQMFEMHKDWFNDEK